MKKVLILTAGFGEGHNAAARNLRDALELTSDDVRVEVLDLFASSYGRLNTLARKVHLGVVQYAPAVWNGIYGLLDSSPSVGKRFGGLTRLKSALADILHQTQPDCVVSTYPVYGHVIADLYQDHHARPFRFLTVITDSITINSTWYRADSDGYCVPNELSAEVLRRAGVPEKKLVTLGFPVSPVFAERGGAPELASLEPGDRRILYVIHSGRKKAGKAIDRLLELPGIQMTITVGRDAALKSALLERTRRHSRRVQVIGWTNQMPHLMKTHHLLIGKAGGATVQEAIAAQCPMIVNQVIPGQEEGNARLIEKLDTGAVAEKGRDVVAHVERAFAEGGTVWRRWRENLAQVSRPDAALRLAEVILAECEWTDPTRKTISLRAAAASLAAPAAPALMAGRGARMLLCDFHTHTNYSDGKLTVPELVDFYGERGFDCVCITDHLADPRRLLGKLSRLSNLTLPPAQLDEYFEVIARERRRAWRKYNLLLMAGLEFNKDGLTKKSSAHLLGIDLQGPIPPALDLPETIAHIHGQRGLAVASHPHIMKSEWGKNTLYLWENQERFAPLIDAWEIANRNDLFTPVGWKRLPFLANSDFHKPKHIYSWKTLLHCDKDPEAIKDCIRRNEHVAITLYRDDTRTAYQPAAHGPGELAPRFCPDPASLLAMSD